MPDLLNIKKNYRWDLSGIEFALKERIGDPEKFIGRKEEMEFLYDWYQMIKRENGETMAFPDQEIIPLFLSRNGLRKEIKDKLLDEGIRISLE